MNYQINSEKILFTQLGDEGVVYDTKKNEYISLNETMFKILKSIEKGQTPTDITLNLCKEYKIEEVSCRQEVIKALLQLQEKGYICQITV